MEGVRQYPRYKVELSVELCSPIDHVPVRAKIADICLGGCYVELSFTRDLSSEVELTLWLDDSKLSAKGIVVSSHPSFGNGIKFTHLEDAARAQLQLFVQNLGGNLLARAPSRQCV